MATDSQKDVPLFALSVETQVCLSTLLNATKIIPTEGNLPRDWRGVAELASVPSESIMMFERRADPFKEVLNYIMSASSSTSRKVNTEDLKAFLSVVDRFDVLNDVTPILDRDVAAYESRVSNLQMDRTVDKLDSVKDENILTYEDAQRAHEGLALCRYDAFILYSEEDEDFASKIIVRMESEYKLKLCSKERDLLPGRFEHEVIGKMIETRCNRLLVIFSPSFLQSPANQFLVSFAQAVALDTRDRKIIPCVYKKCDLPTSVKYSFCIDYNRSGKLWNFWDKLSQSLMVAPTHPPTSTTTATSNGVVNDQTLKNPHTTPPYSADSSFDSWDAEKPPKSLEEMVLSPVPEIHAAGSFSNQFDEHSDAISINSQANLLPLKDSSHGIKPTKWLRKMMGKKRSEKDKSKQQQQQAIAE